MRTVCFVLFTALGSGLRSQAALQIENAALRHQLAVLQRQARGRPGTTVVVPPAKTAKLSQRNPRSSARDGTIRKISRIGRRRWKKEVGYHRQARVENAFFRYKSILGDRLRSRTRAAQAVESVLACNVLNRMTELGRPESFAIDR